MTDFEWRRRNNLMHMELLKDENQPKDENEKDIWNLKYLRYFINKDSLLYQMKAVRTLKKAIKIFEKKSVVSMPKDKKDMFNPYK